eukprot:COSAG02_NODE_51496_length_313_cov_2.144860_1_plen_65_part_01
MSVNCGASSVHRRTQNYNSKNFTSDLRKNAATRGGQRESTVFLRESAKAGLALGGYETLISGYEI